MGARKKREERRPIGTGRPPRPCRPGAARRFCTRLGQAAGGAPWTLRSGPGGGSRGCRAEIYQRSCAPGLGSRPPALREAVGGGAVAAACTLPADLAGFQGGCLNRRAGVHARPQPPRPAGLLRGPAPSPPSPHPPVPPGASPLPGEGSLRPGFGRLAAIRLCSPWTLSPWATGAPPLRPGGHGPQRRVFFLQRLNRPRQEQWSRTHGRPVRVSGGEERGSRWHSLDKPLLPPRPLLRSSRRTSSRVLSLGAPPRVTEKTKARGGPASEGAARSGCQAGESWAVGAQRRPSLGLGPRLLRTRPVLLMGRRSAAGQPAVDGGCTGRRHRQRLPV